MDKNDIFRKLRFAFDYGDDQVIKVFKLGGKEVTRAEISDWLKKDDNPDFKILTDENLAHFLNGFIVLKRGKKEGPTPENEKRLNNNQILRKLKIALELKDEDIVEMLGTVDFRVSKGEISAFFRNPSQDKYRVCKDQIIRNFIQSIILKYGKVKTATENPK